MRYLQYIFSTIFILLVLNGCVSVRYHDYAETDFDLATKYILQLKDDTILIAITTYFDEENVYKRAIKYGSEDVEKNKKRLQKLKNKRAEETDNTIRAYEEYFNFAKALYIPDSLIHSFENGDERAFFLDLDGNLDNSITYNNKSPIKILQPDDILWTVVKNNKILPNPFPNHYNYKNGLSYFLGIASHRVLGISAAQTFQRRFETYYQKPSRRLYY